MRTSKHFNCIRYFTMTYTLSQNNKLYFFGGHTLKYDTWHERSTSICPIANKHVHEIQVHTCMNNHTHCSCSSIAANKQVRTTQQMSFLPFFLPRTFSLSFIPWHMGSSLYVRTYVRTLYNTSAWYMHAVCTSCRQDQY